MLGKVLLVSFCFFIAGTIGLSVYHAPVSYYARESYLFIMMLCIVSGVMIYWIADFIFSD